MINNIYTSYKRREEMRRGEERREERINEMK